MSLSSLVSDLATRIGEEIKAVRAEVVSALSGKADSSHNHAAADVNSGTLGIARVPTGTSGTTVSLGNHNHSGVYEPSGTSAAGIATHEVTADPHPGYLRESVLTAKGDLYVATASGTVVRKPVGSTTGHVLTVDPAEADGMKWAAAGAGGGVDTVTAGDSTITIGGDGVDVTVAVDEISQSQVTGLVTDLAGKQPLDSDLTTISNLTATTDNFMVAASSAWASRTPAQAKTALALVKADVGLGNVDNTSDATKNSATATLTNKRITKRAVDISSTATLTHDADSYDQANITAQSQALSIANPTGTPTSGQLFLLRIKDDGTARAIIWSGSQWRAIGVDLPTTTVINKTLYVGAMWNAADSKWDVLAVNQEA